MYRPGAAVTNDHSWVASSARNCSLSSGSRKSLGAGGVLLCVEGPAGVPLPRPAPGAPGALWLAAEPLPSLPKSSHVTPLPAVSLLSVFPLERTGVGFRILISPARTLSPKRGHAYHCRWVSFWGPPFTPLHLHLRIIFTRLAHNVGHVTHVVL